MREARSFAWRAASALVFAVVCLVLRVSPAGAAETPRSNRPNVIAIVTDDQARWTIGAYGNREVKTPNMDRLAAEGALFLNA